MNWLGLSIKEYIQFSGRSKRGDYWSFVLFCILIFVALTVVDAFTGMISKEAALGAFANLFLLAMLIAYPEAAHRSGMATVQPRAAAPLSLRCFLAALLVAGVLFVCTCAKAAGSQADVLTLQQNTIERLKHFKEQYRHATDIGPFIALLADADVALAESTEALKLLGDDANLALGLIHRGNVWRVQEQNERAIAHYTEALAAAMRAHDFTLQAQALRFKASAENNLYAATPISNARGRGLLLGQARSDVLRALDIAQTADNKDEQFNSLHLLTIIQVERDDLEQAERTSTRQFELVAASTDPLALYLALINRLLVHSGAFKRCDLMNEVPECSKLLESLRVDGEAALEIVTRLNYLPLRQTMLNQLQVAVSMAAMFGMRQK